MTLPIPAPVRSVVLARYGAEPASVIVVLG